jgi:hypothetical protein
MTGILYLGFVGVHWSGSPLPRLLPIAYAVPHLLALTVVANTLNGMVFPYRSELLASRGEMSLLRVEAFGNALRVLLAASAAVVGAFAIPLGAGALAAARWWGYRRALRAYYVVGAERFGQG